MVIRKTPRNPRSLGDNFNPNKVCCFGPWPSTPPESGFCYCSLKSLAIYDTLFQNWLSGFYTPIRVHGYDISYFKFIKWMDHIISFTQLTRKQPALKFNPHSNVIRNFWEKRKMKSALECNPQRFCEFWFLIWITTWPTVMEVASCKNRQNTKENAKIWQFLLKATKLVSLNWKMTPNYSVYFGLMEKKKKWNPHSNVIRTRM